METITVYDPTVPREQKPFALAPRPESLAGLRIGLMDNTKHNSGALLEALAASLVTQSGAAGVQRWQKHSLTQPMRRELADELARSCDVAICGVGD